MVKLGISASNLRAACALIWTLASPFVRVRLALALSLVVAASILTAAGPLALKYMVDGLPGRADRMVVPMLALVALYVSSQWLSRTAGEIRGLIYARAERRMMRILSERMFAHVMSLPLRFHLQRQTGALSQVLQNGLQGYQMVVHTLVFTVVPVASEFATIVIILLRLRQPAFLSLFLGALVCYTVAFAYAAMTIAPAARAASGSHVAANAVMTDHILNYEIIKYFAAESTIQQRVGAAFADTEEKWRHFYRKFARNGLTVATIFAAFLATTLVYALHAAQSGGMTVGTFVLVNAYMLQIVRPVEMVGYAMQSLSQGMAFMEKMLELFREEREPAAITDAAPVGYPGRLDFEHVSVSYAPGRVILNDLSFKILPGKTLGIVGSSGAGKSTVVRVLVRLLEPDSGRVLLDGRPISELSLSSLREAIAVVPQDTVLFDDTIGDNVAFGKVGSSQEEVERAARLARLHEFVAGLQDGYQTRVGERGVKLSGGEKQRVSIARAVLKRPRIYVFDEATSSLDSKTEREILASLREISQHSTTIVIAHRLSTVVHADEIIVLENGSIVEHGAHASLLRQNGRYAALWNAQQHAPVAVAAGLS